jgi:hypothetical protein
MADRGVPVKPHPPWRPHSRIEPARGCLSYYLSDDLSDLPVRAVTLPSNNKSDPNLETDTYGVFSTCSEQMRTSVVRNGVGYVFFITKREERRVLTGYYHIAWYCNNLSLGRPNDFALKSDAKWFIEWPLPLEKLPSRVKDTAKRRFRLFEHIDATQTSILRHLIEEQPNRVTDYVAEIHRLERFNKFHTGFGYPNFRRDSFTRGSVLEYLLSSANEPATPPVKTRNSSRSGLWRCEACKRTIPNLALLRRCPLCGKGGRLRPLSGEELGREGWEDEVRVVGEAI